MEISWSFVSPEMWEPWDTQDNAIQSNGIEGITRT